VAEDEEEEEEESVEALLPAGTRRRAWQLHWQGRGRDVVVSRDEVKSERMLAG
jgi:hypothetical protein